MALHTFHDDDCVIDHQTNRKHQTKERKRVNGKTKQREEYESADQGNRYSQQRNQRGAPALKKQKNNNDDQNQRDHKGLNDFLDALRYRKRRVERNGEVHVLGESLFHLRHQRLDSGRRVDRVRSGQLIRGNNGARLAVKAAGDTVVLRAKLHSSEVAYSNSCAVGCFADNYVAEFLWRNQAPLRENSVGIFLTFGSWLASGLAGGVHRVLCLNRVDDLRHSKTEL